MLDIGFSEIVVCGVVALIVIGPERMPETVRTVGLWIGRMKRGLRNTREEIERQIGVDDIRRQLHNEEILRNLEEARHKMEAMLQESPHLNPPIEGEAHPTYSSPEELPDHAHMHEQHPPSEQAHIEHTPTAHAVESTEPPKPTP